VILKNRKRYQRGFCKLHLAFSARIRGCDGFTFINLQIQEPKVGSEVMINFTIKTHSEKNEYDQPHLFALSRGYNTGKPLHNPCPNCFVILMKTDEERDRMYFLLDGLWRMQVFRRQLVGSVIPFLRVYEFTKTIVKFWKYIHENEDRVVKLMDVFKSVDKIEKYSQSYLKLLRKYRDVAYTKVFDLDKIEI
jgi:hypothetical protein